MVKLGKNIKRIYHSASNQINKITPGIKNERNLMQAKITQVTEELRSQTEWRGNPEITGGKVTHGKLEPGELSLISLSQKMWESEREVEIPPLAPFFHVLISCQCFPLTKCSHEPSLIEPGKYSLQGLPPCKTGQGRRVGVRES